MVEEVIGSVNSTCATPFHPTNRTLLALFATVSKSKRNFSRVTVTRNLARLNQSTGSLKRSAQALAHRRAVCLVLVCNSRSLDVRCVQLSFGSLVSVRVLYRLQLCFAHCCTALRTCLRRAMRPRCGRLPELETWNVGNKDHSAHLLLLLFLIPSFHHFSRCSLFHLITWQSVKLSVLA